MNTKHLTSAIFTLAALILFTPACEREWNNPLDNNSQIHPNDSIQLEDIVSFQIHIEPIFTEALCTSCHNGGLAWNLTKDNAYSSIINEVLAIAGDPLGSKIYYYPHPTIGTHATKYKSIADADLIYIWIEQGALDN